MRKSLLALLVLVASSAAANSAHAFGCEGFGYGFLYNSLNYQVPYFAAHPPVYYSVPVPRTYGYSPFAYPPHIMTPELVSPVQPVQIINPHVKSSSHTPAAKPVEDKSVSTPKSAEPLMVLNPYVTPSDAMVSTER